MLSRLLLPPFYVALALISLACTPKIGDECVTDLDCSQQADRLCDTTQPNGYCTQVDCDPYSCPEKESICISFNDSISSVGACLSRGNVSPYRRNFCMATCEEAKDCRQGYECVDLSEPNPWGAVVIQEYPEVRTVCLVAESYAPIEEDRSDQVCTGLPREASGGGAGGAEN